MPHLLILNLLLHTKPCFSHLPLDLLKCSVFLLLQKTEAWEAEKTVADMEEYSWEDSPSQRNILDVLARMECPVEKEGEEVREELLGRKEVQEYRDSVARLKNEGESEATLTQYKEAVKKVLNL